MSALTIRVAQQDDADVLVRLQAEMDDSSPGVDKITDGESMRDILAAMAAYPDFRAYLVLRDELAVGTFSLMIFSSPAHRGGKQALLDAVVVTRAQRGNGVGEAMIRHALHLAREAACYKMSLSSNLKRTSAHRFYQRLGFSQHGISFGITLDDSHT